ncbi:MAG TPA: NAD-dependent epimerase/dehydratase family protein [Thermodesulfobacteriota bacterium]|nr:NAD-dependent epimerase/dehydratase family protein [Thermodesulfobacteriota bacterium]
MKILVTGGCGFIGTNLIEMLLGSGSYEISILDNLSAGNMSYLKDVLESHRLGLSYVDFINGDIRNMSVVKQAWKGVHAVVHLAAHAGVVPSVENPFHDAEVNVTGTLNLLEASRKAGVERFVFASSNAPLGVQSPPMNEEKPPRPLSPYGASKLAGEGYCSAFRGSFGLGTVVLRFSNAYGPWSLHKASVIAKFIKDGMSGGSFTIYGDGFQTRDFIHAEDISRAIVGVLESGSDDIFGETFHLGTGQETRIGDLARIVSGLFGGSVRTVHVSERAGEIKRNYSDIGKAERILGFRPAVGLEEGVKRVFDWFIYQGTDAVKKAVALSGSD